MIDFELETPKQGARIKVLGIGGAGGNTVNSIIDSGCEEIECIVANTDAQALEHSKAPHKVQIGLKATKGLGTGANPELGQRSAEEDLDKIMAAIGQADIVFLTGGMGGGTGSGALPVVARALKDHGILAIAVVTKPFTFEGKRRARVAQEALDLLKESVDTLIVIPNQKLLDVVDQNVSMLDAFSMINEVLNHSVKGISNIITKPGHINVDFADVRTIMKDMGLAVLGTGRASGSDRAWLAAEQAISSPLLENMSIDGARAVLLNITGGASLGLHEISQAASVIYEKADEDGNIILGSVIDPSMGDEVSVTIIATGLNHRLDKAKEEAEAVIAHARDEAAAIAKAHEEAKAIAELHMAQELQKIEAAKKQAEALVSELLTAQEAAKKEQARIIEEQEMAALLAAQEAEQLEAAIAAELEEKALVDNDDLDVPAFMRKEVEKSNNA